MSTPTLTPPLNPLVAKVRAAHPGAYDDMDDAALTKAVLNKYPQYSDLAGPGLPKPPNPITNAPEESGLETGPLTSYNPAENDTLTHGAGTARALARDVNSAAGTIAGIPSAIYHAYTDPPQNTSEQNLVAGHNPTLGHVALGGERMLAAPIRNAAQWYKQAAQGKIPNPVEQALSVAPEAVGAGAGNVLAGAGVESIPDIVKGTRQMIPSDTTATATRSFQQAVPPTKSAPYTPEDLQNARPHLEDQHASNPIKTVSDVRDAADAAVKKIETHVGNAVKANPIDQITSNPLADVRTGLSQNIGAPEGYAEQGMQELAPYKLDEPMTVSKADAVRKQLNAENKAIMDKNSYDRATARATDPGFAARELAAESLRNGVYDKLAERGMPGVDQLRQDEGSLLSIRDAAQNQILNGEKTVAGTGSSSKLAKAGKTILTGGGVAAGEHFGGMPGAVLGGTAGAALGDLLAPSNLTRNALVEKSFARPVTNGAAGSFPAIPKPSPTRGLLNAPPVSLSSPMEASPSTSVPPVVANTTRAQRLGLLLPEQASGRVVTPQQGYSTPVGSEVGGPLEPKAGVNAPFADTGPQQEIFRNYASAHGPQYAGKSMGETAKVGNETWAWNGKEWHELTSDAPRVVKKAIGGKQGK